MLFNPTANNVLAKLDDNKSMFSVALQDAGSSVGRMAVERSRGPHATRERIIEEALTLLIWGYGINFMKNQVYDRLAPKIFPKIQKPNLNIDLLSKKNPQHLSEGTYGKFRKAFGEIYQDLDAVVTKPTVQQAYRRSNIAKFIIATIIPVLLIAFGIPTFNQWLTRKKVANEKQTKLQQTMSVQTPAQNGSQASTQTSFRHPSLFNGFEGRIQQNTVLQPSSGKLRFQGLGTLIANTASTFLQNEQYNTLLVDGVLSGGRIAKARNENERIEISWREGAIIFFLYFAQKFIKTHIANLIDQIFKTNSQMEFQAMRHLRETYGTGEQLTNLSKDLDASRKLVFEHVFKGIQDNQGLSNTEKLQAYVSGKMKDDHQQIEKKMAELIRELFLNQETDKAKLLIETGKTSQWIPMLKGGVHLDLSQKIQVEPMLRFLHSMESVTQGLTKEGNASFGKLIKRNMTARFGAMSSAMAICGFFLGYLFPKIQQWITYKRTGKNYFPGVDPDPATSQATSITSYNTPRTQTGILPQPLPGNGMSAWTNLNQRPATPLTQDMLTTAS
jgi:hypothetical protein